MVVENLVELGLWLPMMLNHICSCQLAQLDYLSWMILVELVVVGKMSFYNHR